MHLIKRYLTENDCYKSGRIIKPKGIMVHSTAVNNPRISRYVSPDNGDIGKPSAAHWNKPGVKKCVHAFIGKLADGTVGTCQTLPWNMRGWHCAGRANDTHISFEICEDSKYDSAYFNAVYREAVELVAYLCDLYNLDPLEDGVVICHSEGYQRRIASNHADVMHWFPIHGKNMDTFRKDVAERMGEELTQERFNELMDNYLSNLAKQPPSEWSAEARAWAEGKGIITGNAAGEKMYKSPCTREQMVIFLKRAMEGC